MSEFGGGKWPNFGGGKCPPGKWLTIIQSCKFFDKSRVCLWSLKNMSEAVYNREFVFTKTKQKKTIPGESLIGLWLFLPLPPDLPDSMICQDVTCPRSKSSRKQSLIHIYEIRLFAHIFQVSFVMLQWFSLSFLLLLLPQTFFAASTSDQGVNIISYTLWEHDDGSPNDGRTSSNM